MMAEQLVGLFGSMILWLNANTKANITHCKHDCIYTKTSSALAVTCTVYIANLVKFLSQANK